MKIAFATVLVDDQEKALDFYTRVLGFEKRLDLPAGDARWLTVVSREAANGVELVLEPLRHPAAEPYQRALFADGVPAISFESADIAAEHRCLARAGVVFRMPPTPMGPATVARFEDTCGNVIQIHQVVGAR